MYDIVEGIHKALRFESTWAFVGLMALGGCIVFGTVAWIIDTGYKNSPEYKAEHVINFKPSVVIDEISTEYINFHFQLENQPDAPALLDVKYGSKTQDAFQQEFVLVRPRSLLPGGKLSIIPPPAFLKNREYNSITLTLDYTLKNDEGNFRSTCRFMFTQAQARQGNVIDPQDCHQERVSKK
jgi:hypothetical protein